MYSPGDTLYLVSQNLSGSDLLDVNLADAHALLKSPGRIVATGKPAHVSGQQPPLIYQMCITHAYTPFTMSVVCRARLTGVYKGPAALAPFIPLPPDTSDATPLAIESPSDIVDGTASIGPEYILKLFDHRCFVNIRQDCELDGPYAMENARAYHKYHRGPPAPYFSKFFWDMPGVTHERPWTESDIGLFEAWMEVDARRTFETEVSVYNILADLQGQVVPKVLDTISSNTPFVFEPTPSVVAGSDNHDMTTMNDAVDNDLSSDSSSSDQDVNLDGVDLTRLATGHRVYGILMEYVPGMSLRTFIDDCLRSGRPELRAEVASIADEAVALILEIGRYPMLNSDIRLDNVLVRESYVATLSLNLEGADSHTTECDPRASSELSPSESCTATIDNPTSVGVSRCVAIDFGESRLRFEDETDEQWRCAKLFRDEEGSLVDALSWEMRQVFKEILGRELSLEEDPKLQQACREAQAEVWTYERVRPWYRKLSPEDQSAYEMNPRWGQHPKA